MAEHEKFIRMAIELAEKSVDQFNGGPFGAVIVKDGTVVGVGTNQVTNHTDPTAHAEVQAIRDACQNLGSFQLDGCIIYSSCEPCPMCLGAIYWARPEALYYGASKMDAADADFDDAFIYEELGKPAEGRKLPTFQILDSEAKKVFDKWRAVPDKIKY